MSIRKIATNSSPIRYTKFNDQIPIKSPLKDISILSTIPIPLSPPILSPILSPTKITPLSKATKIKNFFKKNYMMLGGVSILILIISLSLYFGLKTSSCNIDNLKALIVNLNNDITKLENDIIQNNLDTITYETKINKINQDKQEYIDNQNLAKDPDTLKLKLTKKITDKIGDSPDFKTGTINDAINDNEKNISDKQNEIVINNNTIQKLTKEITDTQSNIDNSTKDNKTVITFILTLTEYLKKLEVISQTINTDVENLKLINDNYKTYEIFQNYQEVCDDTWATWKITLYVIVPVFIVILICYCIYHVNVVLHDGGIFLKNETEN